MLENHINRIIEYCDKIIFSKEFYYIEDLNQLVDMPKFLKRYINSFINHKIESDLNKIKELSYYDFSNSKNYELLTEFSSLLKDSIFLSQEQLRLIIEDIIHLHFNFLIRPRNTLLINFDKNSKIQISTIIEKYQIFNDYEYLINQIFHKLNDFLSNSNEVTYSELENIIENIDNEYIFGKTSKDFIELVEPIYSLFNIYNNDTNEQIVPTEALMIFFDDKSLLPIVELLESKFQYDNLKFVSKNQLLEILVEILDSIIDDTNSNVSNILDNIDNELYDTELKLTDIDSLDNNFDSELVTEKVLKSDLVTGLDNDLEIDSKIDLEFQPIEDINLEDEFLKDLDIDSGKIDTNDLSAYGFDLSDFEDDDDFLKEIGNEVENEEVNGTKVDEISLELNNEDNQQEFKQQEFNQQFDKHKQDFDIETENNTLDMEKLGEVLHSFESDFDFEDEFNLEINNENYNSDNSIDLNKLDELLK